MKTIQVLNKRNNLVETAVIDGDKITVEGRDLSESTFRRWYKEVEVAPEEKTEGGNNVNPDHVGANVADEVVKPDEVKDVVEEVTTGDVTITAEVEEPKVEVVEEQNEDQSNKSADEAALAALLAGGQELKPETPKPPRAATPEADNVPTYNPTLIEGHTVGTKGGKCDKTFTSIAMLGKVLNITEYNGFITDVRVLEQKDDELVEIYKSPKMSLKDTLEYLKLDPDQIKAARKEIVALRKQSKETFKAEAEATV